MAEAAAEGTTQDPGQGPESGVTEDPGAQTGGGDDRYANLESQVELLTDTVTELRDALVQSRHQQSAPVEEDIDPDDPEITPRKIEKIVQKNLNQALAVNQQQSQRTTWDEKAKQDFPLADPKFQKAFKTQWKKMANSGLDPNHPQAVYTVAEVTALGFKKPEARSPSAEISSEAPTTHTPSASRPGARKATVDDNDQRLRFYNMRGNRTPEQIAEFKAKLAADDANKAEQRRARR